MKIRSALKAGLLTLTLFGFALPPLSPAYAAKPGKSAATRKSVTLGAIQGQKADTRKWVIAALESDFTVTDADGLEAPGKDSDVAQLAKDLGADAIIFGKLEKNKLTLIVRSAADGKAVGEIELPGAGPKLKKAIQKDLSAGVAGLLGTGAAAADEEEDEEPKKPKKPPVADEEDEEDAEDAEDAEDGEGEGEEEEGEGEAEEGEAEAEADEGDEDSGADEKPSKPSGLPSILLTVGIKGNSRKFDYKDRLSDLRPAESCSTMPRPSPCIQDPAKYSVILPTILLRGEIYPFALFGSGSGSFLENIGLAGAFELGLPTKSSYTGIPQGQTVAQTVELENRTQDFWLGPRLRLGLGAATTVGLTIAYGQHKFFLVGDEGGQVPDPTPGAPPGALVEVWPPPLVPDVKYGYLRAAADTTFEFGSLTAGFLLGARKLLSYGELDSVWFPGVKGDGFEVGVLLGYHLSPMFTAVGGFEVLRYGFDMNAIPSDNRIVAGGALDTYLSFWVGMRMRLPGSESASISASTE